MRFMICYAVEHRSAKVETEYFDRFEDAVMRYTVLCSNCTDVVLARTTSEEIIRHFSFRQTMSSVAVSDC